MKVVAAVALLGLLSSCADPDLNCRSVEPARVKLAGKTYSLTKSLGGRIVGEKGETEVSVKNIGSGRERRTTYCFEGPSDTPGASAIVFDGDDAANVNNRFISLNPLSQVAILRGGNSRVYEGLGNPGPLPGMTRYDRKGFYDLDATSIPGWDGRVWGQCSIPKSINRKLSCRVQAALTPTSFLSIDIYGDDIQSERWAEFFNTAKDFFASLES